MKIYQLELSKGIKETNIIASFASFNIQYCIDDFTNSACGYYRSHKYFRSINGGFRIL